MKRILRFGSNLLAWVVPLVLAVTVSGCLLGLGAAAGAAVGGCSLLDQNEDDRITQEEFSSGLFAEWDSNSDDTLSESEFDAGVEREEIFTGWTGGFGEWDTDDDDALTEAEFRAGVVEDEDAPQWLDRQCDDLGL